MRPPSHPPDLCTVAAVPYRGTDLWHCMCDNCLTDIIVSKASAEHFVAEHLFHGTRYNVELWDDIEIAPQLSPESQSVRNDTVEEPRPSPRPQSAQNRDGSVTSLPAVNSTALRGGRWSGKPVMMDGRFLHDDVYAAAAWATEHREAQVKAKSSNIVKACQRGSRAYGHVWAFADAKTRQCIRIIQDART